MKKVLVLEDEANIRSFVVINLKRAGYEAIEAESGEEALAQLKRNPDIKVALLDIMLPDMDGFEVCRRIRDSKVILGDAGLGGLTSQEDFDELCALGCRMFTVGSDMACVKQAVVGKRKSFDAFKQTHFAEK